MHVNGEPFRTIWPAGDGQGVNIIDQRWLPHDFRVVALTGMADCATAIREMWVRGAPLIGATAAYGVALALRRDPSDAGLADACAQLRATRPTAINLAWALGRMRAAMAAVPEAARADAAWDEAGRIAEEDVAINAAIGEHGFALIRDIAAAKGGAPVGILTHCNAGWLATVDWGTATAPIYKAHAAGVALHVWIDETRPRNQGAQLTAWELGSAGVPHTLVVDNAGGHLMQRGQVDLVLVGSDRTTAAGDVCNKIGTYLKALAAHDNGVPFHVALPSPTIDWTIDGTGGTGLAAIPIEERDGAEVTHVWGRQADGALGAVRIAPEATRAANPAFDVTPARLVTGLVTERGRCAATQAGLRSLFPDSDCAEGPGLGHGGPGQGGDRGRGPS